MFWFANHLQNVRGWTFTKNLSERGLTKAGSRIARIGSCMVILWHKRNTTLTQVEQNICSFFSLGMFFFSKRARGDSNAPAPKLIAYWFFHTKGPPPFKVNKSIVPGTLFARPRRADVPWVYQPHSSCCHRDFPPQPTVFRLGDMRRYQANYAKEMMILVWDTKAKEYEKLSLIGYLNPFEKTSQIGSPQVGVKKEYIWNILKPPRWSWTLWHLIFSSTSPTLRYLWGRCPSNRHWRIQQRINFCQGDLPSHPNIDPPRHWKTQKIQLNVLLKPKYPILGLKG